MLQVETSIFHHTFVNYSRRVNITLVNLTVLSELICTINISIFVTVSIGLLTTAILLYYRKAVELKREITGNWSWTVDFHTQFVVGVCTRPTSHASGHLPIIWPVLYYFIFSI
jgi:hypothetical protein